MAIDSFHMHERIFLPHYSRMTRFLLHFAIAIAMSTSTSTKQDTFLFSVAKYKRWDHKVSSLTSTGGALESAGDVMRSAKNVMTLTEYLETKGYPLTKDPRPSMPASFWKIAWSNSWTIEEYCQWRGWMRGSVASLRRLNDIMRVDMFGNVISVLALSDRAAADWARDHWFPWARGGPNDAENMVACQHTANKIKNAAIMHFADQSTVQVGISVQLLWRALRHKGMLYDTSSIWTLLLGYDIHEAKDAKNALASRGSVKALKLDIDDALQTLRQFDLDLKSGKIKVENLHRSSLDSDDIAHDNADFADESDDTVYDKTHLTSDLFDLLEKLHL